jgi:hypothetical protein
VRQQNSPVEICHELQGQETIAFFQIRVVLETEAVILSEAKNLRDAHILEILPPDGRQNDDLYHYEIDMSILSIAPLTSSPPSKNALPSEAQEPQFASASSVLSVVQCFSLRSLRLCGAPANPDRQNFTPKKLSSPFTMEISHKPFI